MSSNVEIALAAAFHGPEQTKLRIFDHEFNIKKMERIVSGVTTIAHGQISHCLANRIDDQIYYDIAVVNGRVTMLNRQIERGGWSRIWAAIAPFVSSLSNVEAFNDQRITEAITDTEGFLNGQWLGVVDYLLGLFAIQIAAGFTTGQMGQALTIQSQLTDGFAVYGEIKKKYDALGGRSGFLGKPLTDETGTPDGIGRYNVFDNGSIYWSPNTAAHEVHGNIRNKWQQFGWEQGVLGYPATDETTTPDGVGRYNHFENGSIYWTQQTDAWEVHGSIRDKWATLGWERSSLGYPTSDEHNLPGGGRVSKFQHGRICWRQDRGAWVETQSFVKPPVTGPFVIENASSQRTPVSTNHVP